MFHRLTGEPKGHKPWVYWADSVDWWVVGLETVWWKSQLM